MHFRTLNVDRGDVTKTNNVNAPPLLSHVPSQQKNVVVNTQYCQGYFPFPLLCSAVTRIVICIN